jgi:hypothetical protein
MTLYLKSIKQQFLSSSYNVISVSMGCNNTKDNNSNTFFSRVKIAVKVFETRGGDDSSFDNVRKKNKEKSFLFYV